MHSEMLWELQLDTRCLLGWSDSKIVLAFRGTASISNAWADLQVIYFLLNGMCMAVSVCAYQVTMAIPMAIAMTMAMAMAMAVACWATT